MLTEQYITLLKPFEEISKIKISGWSCVSEILLHVAVLRKYLDKYGTMQNTLDSSHMRASSKAELERRFSLLNQYSNYLFATNLDRRFKVKYWGAVKAERVRQKIFLEFIKMYSNESSSSSSWLSPVKELKREKTALVESRTF